MTFSEIPYIRPNYPVLFQDMQALTTQLQQATSAEEQLVAYREMEELDAAVDTQVTVCSIRNSIDTRDSYYDEEQTYHDQQMPLYQEYLQQFNRALVESPFRKELEQELSPLLFLNLEMELRSFSGEIIPLMQEENKYSTAYQKLYASARIPFDGKICNVAQLGSYKESTDRQVRKAAYAAEGTFFDENRHELDSLFDKLVKNRTAQAKALGFDSFVELAALRRLRNCYSTQDVATFREKVVQELVPLTVQIHQQRAMRTGIPDNKYYDHGLKFKEGSPTPSGTPEEILEAGKTMYTELSPETAEFIDMMFRMELFDVVAKEGKAPGGYCTNLELYNCTFIFSNFNGTSGDVDVLTHEAGHAFASYVSSRTIETHALRHPTMDCAETHSMGMEFLTSPWHHLFFKEQTEKYQLSHMEDALLFIPYGCMVDHFQTEVYRNPDWTPEERHQLWAELEKKYRPYNDFEDLPFYSRGAGWQRQLHIYTAPFYYIDYSMAQVMALQLFSLSLENREEAWTKYLDFLKLGGTKTFVDLARSAGLDSPLENTCMKKVCQTAKTWLDAHSIS